MTMVRGGGFSSAPLLGGEHVKEFTTLQQAENAALRVLSYTASRLAESISGALEDINGSKQDKLTGAAGELLGFNTAGEASALTISSADIAAAQSGTNLTLSLKNSGVTAGAFGVKSHVIYGCTWTSNNGGKASSTAQTTLTAKQACTVSFDYSYSSEANYDKFTLTVGAATVENAVSGAATSKSYSGSLASGGAIVFKYAKDGSQDKNDDCCTFSNFTVKVGEGPAVLLNSQNIGTYFTVVDGTYKFVPEDYCAKSYATLPVAAVDEKGRITRISEGAVLRLHGRCTIPTSGWSSDSTADYPYYYDIAVAEVTAADRADVAFAPANVMTAVNCGMCPFSETLGGKVRLRAAKAPAAAISAEYWIEKG